MIAATPQQNEPISIPGIKLPTGMEIGIIVQVILKQTEALIHIADVYAKTQDPIMHNVGEALFRGAIKTSEAIAEIGKSINTIAAQRGLSDKTGTA